MIETEVTYLEMLAPPDRDPVLMPPGVHVVHAAPPSLRFYRFLYAAVGSEWQWVDRSRVGDEELAAIVHDPQVEVHVLWVEGSPAGYVELDLREPDQIEIAYFGIMPEYFGRGLGRLFLSWAIDEAFRRRTPRLWVHTCDLDHPAALPNYQRCGFRIYRRRRAIQVIPEE